MCLPCESHPWKAPGYVLGQGSQIRLYILLAYTVMLLQQHATFSSATAKEYTASCYFNGVIHTKTYLQYKQLSHMFTVLQIIGKITYVYKQKEFIICLFTVYTQECL